MFYNVYREKAPGKPSCTNISLSTIVGTGKYVTVVFTSRLSWSTSRLSWSTSRLSWSLDFFLLLFRPPVFSVNLQFFLTFFLISVYKGQRALTKRRCRLVFLGDRGSFYVFLYIHTYYLRVIFDMK